MKGPIREYLRDKAIEGSHEGSGTFGLDVEKALAKLEKFRMAERGDYLVKLLQAAVSSQAQAFELQLGVRYVDVSFKLAPEHLHHLEKLPMALLGRAQYPNRSLHHLGVGLQAALSVAKYVELRVNDTVLLTLGGRASTAGNLPELKPGRRARVTIAIRRKNMLAGLQQRFGEYGSFVKRTRYCPIPVSVDGFELRRGWERSSRPSFFYLAEAYLSPPQPLPPLAFPASNSQRFNSIPGGWSRWNRADWGNPLDCPSFFRKASAPVVRGSICCKAALVVSSRLGRYSELVFVLDGASTIPQSKAWGFPGLQLVLSGEGLETDLTELQILENDEYWRRVGSLEEELREVARAIQNNSGELRSFLRRSLETSIVRYSLSEGSLPRPEVIRVQNHGSE